MNSLVVPALDLAVAFELRNELRPGELGVLVSLHGAFYAQECGFDSTFEAHVAQLLGQFVHARTDREQLWIAEWQGRIVGSVAIVRHSGRDAQLCWFLVDPSVRSLGLGRRLLDEAVLFCRHWEYECVFLRDFHGLTTSSWLFRSAGFEKVGERPSEHWGVAVAEELYVLHPLGRAIKEHDDE